MRGWLAVRGRGKTSAYQQRGAPQDGRANDFDSQGFANRRPGGIEHLSHDLGDSEEFASYLVDEAVCAIIFGDREDRVAAGDDRLLQYRGLGGVSGNVETCEMIGQFFESSS